MKFVSAAHLTGGGTITGDLTISGDLTVSGGGSMTFSETVTDNVANYAMSIINQHSSGLGLRVRAGGSSASTMALVLENSAQARMFQAMTNGDLHITSTTEGASDAGVLLKLTTNDGTVMESGDRLGVIEFAGRESDASNTITVGARIEAVTDATWSDSENGAYLSFYTTDGNASQSEKMRITSDGKVTITAGDDYPQIHMKDSGGNVDGQIYATGGQIGFVRGDGGAWLLKLDTNSRISLSNNDSGGDSGDGTSTSGNTTFGYLAGEAIASGGIFNTLLGHKSGTDITTGDSNIIIGAHNAVLMTTAINNVSIGHGAMNQVPAGQAVDGVVAIGFEALKGAAGTEGGTESGIGGTVAIGDSALNALTTGSGNMALGYKSQNVITVGAQNTSLGYESLLFDVGGKRTTAIGNSAARQQDGGDTATNMDNVAIGHAALYYNVTGTDNVVIGQGAAYGAGGQSHSNNVAIGANSLGAVTTGGNNVAIGSGAGDALTSTSENVAVGSAAMGAAGTSNSTCVGFAAGASMTGGSNTVVGSASGYSLLAGTENVAVGRNSLLIGTTGTGNTMLGFKADVDVAADSYQTKIGHYGIKKWKTARVTINDYTPGSWTNDDAATTALFSVPQFSHVSKVWCRLITKSSGTAIYNIAMGTAPDEAVGDVIAGRVELLGLHSDGTATKVRTQASQTSHTDILASTGDTEGMVWVSNINVETDNSVGWCDVIMYFYVCAVSTNNATSDPGTSAILDIGVEYY